MILEHLRGRKHVVTSSGLFIDGNWEFGQSTGGSISNYSNQIRRIANLKNLG